jgi:hypothetical protein
MAIPTSDASVINPPPPPPPGNQLVFLNVGSQIYIKLDGENYPAWLIQFRALLTGYDLFGYVDGTKPCPSKTLQNAATINPDYTHWIRHLLLQQLLPISALSPMPNRLGTFSKPCMQENQGSHHGFKATYLHFWERNSINGCLSPRY